MNKQKPRIIIGWRHRQTDVRDIRTRMRVSVVAKVDSVRTAEALKKKH